MSRSGSIMSQDNHLGGRNYSGSTLPLPHKETDDMMKYKTIAVSFIPFCHVIGIHRVIRMFL